MKPVRLFFLLFILFGSVHASESKSEEAKPEESKSEKTLEPVQYSGQQDTSWMALQSELTSLKNKVDSQKKSIDELLLLKKSGVQKNSKENDAVLLKKHLEYRDLVKKYNLKVNEFETKFPEKGIDIGRIYKRSRTQTLEQMENNLTLSDRIQKINKKIKSQYQIKDSHEDPQVNHSEVDSRENNLPKDKSLNKKPKTDVTDKIIIIK